MFTFFEERASDSPYIEKIMHGVTAGDASVIRPAASHWHMVFSTRNGKLVPLVVGPLTSAGTVSWTKEAEILWIQFKIGTFMPHMPFRNILDRETTLPEASSQSFWLNSSVWQCPNFENADTFVNKLARQGALASDQVVTAALEEKLPELASPRTVRHRFLHATGLSQKHIRQLVRAQQAVAQLTQGNSILDVVSEAGYSDQPHLTRSLKLFIGYTPTQIIQLAT